MSILVPIGKKLSLELFNWILWYSGIIFAHIRREIPIIYIYYYYTTHFMKFYFFEKNSECKKHRAGLYRLVFERWVRSKFFLILINPNLLGINHPRVIKQPIRSCFERVRWLSLILSAYFIFEQRWPEDGLVDVHEESTMMVRVGPTQLGCSARYLWRAPVKENMCTLYTHFSIP